MEAVLNRAIKLPGTQRFIMDKAEESALLKPLVHSKQKLQIGILSCAPAMSALMLAFDTVFSGSRAQSSISSKTFFPEQPDHKETRETLEATERLKLWQKNGSVLDGKQRREALSALEALDITLEFYKKLIQILERDTFYRTRAIELNEYIAIFEQTIDRLVIDHLPFVRRFAARNLVDGEDLEDVFAVAFMGLQRASMRFDVERGYRFVTYATYWMRQAISRWRADEGTEIRVPVHRQIELARFTEEKVKLESVLERKPNQIELGDALSWDVEKVRQFQSIPVEKLNMDAASSLDEILHQFIEDENTQSIPEFQNDLKRVIASVLLDLSSREEFIIRSRFGLSKEEMTLEEVGEIFGVTRERIRQLESKAIEKLQHPSRSRQLRIYWAED